MRTQQRSEDPIGGRGIASRLGLVLLLVVAIAAGLVVMRPAHRADATGPGTWTTVAPMPTARGNHTATLLLDGRVLVVGGNTSGGSPVPTGAAEIYNPMLDTWASVAPLHTPRWDQLAFRLADGRVAVVGGVTTGAVPALKPEIYDPALNTWTEGTASNLELGIRSAVLRADGTIVAIGIHFNGVGTAPYADTLDPGTGTWTLGPVIGQPSGAAIVLPNGDILVNGGYWGGALTISVRYPLPNSPYQTGEMSVARDRPADILLGDGRVLVLGSTNDVDIFSPSSNTYTPAAPIGIRRDYYGATMLPNGLVLVTGGYGVQSYARLDSTVAYNPAVDAWSTLAPMNAIRSQHTQTVLADGRVLVTGGSDNAGMIASAEVYEAGPVPPPDTPTIVPTPTNSPTITPTPTTDPDAPTPTFTATSTPVGTPTYTPTPGGPTPTFTPTGIATVPPGLPDLIITSVWIQLQSGGGCSTSPFILGTSVTVKNDGTGPAGAHNLTVNGTPLAAPSLAAGDSYTLWASSYVWPNNPLVVVDSGNVVVESNEDNNTFSQPVPIPTLPPTCTPAPPVTVTVTPTPTRTSTPAFTSTPVVCQSDVDGDGVNACVDNCPGIANPGQINTDAYVWQQPGKPYNDATRPRSDSLGDLCDDDDDNDGLTDAAEMSGPPCANASGPTLPLLSDTDGDRYLDGAECTLPGGNPNDPAMHPACGIPDLNTDLDGDLVLKGAEVCFYNTDPDAADTDGDGCPDGREVASINLDQAVNSIDLSQVAQAYGRYDVPPPPWMPHFVNFDMNKDGAINAMDLMFIARQFGSCPPPS